MKSTINKKKVNKELQKLYNLDFINELNKIPRIAIYLFGGAIRDLMLGKPWKEADIRIVLNLPWEEREKAIENALKKEKIEGKERIKNENLTVYRFLPKGSTTKHAIDLSLVSTIKDNLPDFTINSLFFNLISGELLDQYGGINDLNNKLLKTVKDPFEQFKQEPQMMLRAVKCVCQFNLQIEGKTLEALKKNSRLAEKTLQLIYDKKTGILIELFQSNVYRGFLYNPEKCFELFKDIGILNAFWNFIEKNSDLKKENTIKIENPFQDQPPGQFEKNIAKFLIFLAKDFVGDKQNNFYFIKKLLVLDRPKQYLDFEVDVEKIKY